MKKTRRCKICKVRFEPKYSAMQPTCNEPSCMAQHGRNEVARQEKEKVDAMKEKQKDVPYFKKKLSEKVQAIARHLDFGKGCISCGKPPYGMVYGGHRWAKGNYSQIRFDLHNINAQCYTCNEGKSGNADGYVQGLRERYGEEYLQYVQGLPFLYTETKLNLHEIRLAYAKAVKIESSLKNTLKRLEPEEVIRMKNEFNLELGYHTQIFNPK
jgi:hypothetical protein